MRKDWGLSATLPDYGSDARFLLNTCASSTMLETLNIFSRQNHYRDAVLGLARIINRFELVNMGFEEGLRDERRKRDQHHVAWGVWLFPVKPNGTAADVNLKHGLPAVTHDLRAEGVGIMTPLRLQGEHFVLAMPDEEDDSWRFFRCVARHNTQQPGGWHQLGLQVERVIKFEQLQLKEFREHIRHIATVSADA
ncbi:MAG: hypothetical protein R3C49_27660 [Planctomycetaceae bacterium]